MTNRHERRRAAKVGSVRMSLADVVNMASRCAWAGCNCITRDPDKDGWSKLILYRGRTTLNIMEIPPDKWDRDAVLCPDHAKVLHEEVLVNISGVRELFNSRPAGNA